MSFHGCILSGFAGIPAVPVSAGAYYDRKYVGFDRYGDGRPVPIVRLDGQAPPDPSRVVDYVRRYDAAAAGERRRAAARDLEAYYRSIAAAVGRARAGVPS